MGGFFPHTGGSPSNYTALSMTTFATILDDIVTDIGTGVNGWTLFDDQRSPGSPPVAFVNVTGSTTASNTVTFTNGSATIAGANAKFLREFNPTVSQVSIDNVTYYTVTAVASNSSATISPNFSGTTTGYHNVYVKQVGYIVLKCTSTQKTFYVRLMRGVGYGNALRIDVWETWNNSTHTGTNPSNQELLRAYDVQKTSSTNLQYVLFLLPDTFGLYVGANPGESGNLWYDFAYASNLTPYRNGDTNCLLFACTNQELSGIGTSTAIQATAAYTGGAQCLRNVGGTLWGPTNPTVQAMGYAVYPRGMPYYMDINRGVLDDSGKFQFCDLDAYGTSGGTAGVNTEGKRGDLKYVKTPVGWPSGGNFNTYGTADDGNTYMLLKATPPSPISSGAATPGVADVVTGTTNAGSGFSFGHRTGTVGEIVNSGATNIWVPRFILMPINL